MKYDIMNEQKYYLAKRLADKTVMVSGATGLVGSAIVRYLLKLNDNYGNNIKAVALYKDEDKKNKVFSELNGRKDLFFAIFTAEDGVQSDIKADYIIHAAGIPGGAKMHLRDPKKLFSVGINGTRLMLDYAVSHGCKGFCFVSSYEIYGGIDSEELIKEDHDCSLDPMILRNCYAEVKRVCESMLAAYSAKYRINVFSGRLTSTFGTGVAYDDPRFFAEFGRCAIEERNIILKSAGRTVRSYLDVDDAASAFLYILVNGETNNAYNLTNMENEISIRDIAYKIIKISGAEIELRFDITEDIKALGFRSEGRTVMDASKLENIGWKPVYSFEETLEKLLDSMRKNGGSGVALQL